MLYRAEIIANKEVIASMNFPDNNPATRVTHPQQAMRKVVDELKKHASTQQQFMTVHVLNEDGQLWTYQLQQKSNGDYTSKSPRKSRMLLPSHVRHEIFSGNTTIHEVIA